MSENKQKHTIKKKKRKFNSHRMCSVPGCLNRKTESHTLHLFPKDKQLQETWKANCKIQKNISKNFVVCSDHFLDSDYKSSE